MTSIQQRRAALRELLASRIAILDGAMGTMVQQHRLIYAALGDRMGGEIHALALRTLTPEAWQGSAGS